MKNLTSLLGSKKFMVFVSYLGVYLLASGTSWALFSYIKEPNEIVDVSEGRNRIDPNLPKTEECPINGKMYSKPEREIWETRRPITAVIENHADSRPQSGLSNADVIYEVVAEGGITRFLSVFYCGVSVDDIKVAPIRSARVYLVDWAAGYGKKPIFVHIGGANNICGNCPGGVKPVGQVAREADAFRFLESMSWRSAKGNAFDGGTNIGYPIIVRDQYRLDEKSAWEHSVVGLTDKIFKEAENRGFSYEDVKGEAWNKNFTSWKFNDDSPLSTPKATQISFEFWSNKSDYDVSWKYEKEGNRYLRFNGGKEHVDHETNLQLFAKNVVVIFVKERGPVDKEGHMFYTTTGEGEALIFQNGDVVQAVWRKRTQDDQLRFFDSKGVEITLVRGETWIEAIPVGNKVDYN
ncbi:hypothetical protein A2Z67_01885 [Candidatus Woesebacteria bacterium RBG_13_36_22]|uniref:DUF3048 domain-containing protein n=1 Tax=Candidatus Woesebacteria bacterium RBG_13_36_22 TaxID=1802478 RepID=A0A1F7X132_9BACT|nr:MAG: hypothetical protein A2Z67_01885 [Candidatus Woesebacteria bacterium RBG_13_36_22]